MASRARTKKPALSVVRGDASADSRRANTEARGVYQAYYTTPGGERTLYAIDSRERKVAEAIVSEQGEGFISAQLWKFLDAVDPVHAAPTLLLVQ